MKLNIKSKIGKYFLYPLLCIFVFLATNLLIGWLVKDDNWLYKDDRPIIYLFVVLNLYIDFMAISLIQIKIKYI